MKDLMNGPVISLGRCGKGQEFARALDELHELQRLSYAADGKLLHFPFRRRGDKQNDSFSQFWPGSIGPVAAFFYLSRR